MSLNFISPHQFKCISKIPLAELSNKSQFKLQTGNGVEQLGVVSPTEMPKTQEQLYHQQKFY